MDYKEDITREELNGLPIKAFSKEIFVIESLEDAVKAAQYLKNQTVLGFDTETKPCFLKGKRNNVALLQLATEDYAFLIRCCKIGLPDEIAQILADENIKKVGVAIRDDVKGLQKWRGFVPGGFVELSSFAQKFGISAASLKKLCGIVLGFRISKAMQLSNWEDIVLKPKQQVYGATDAWAGYKIYKQLTQEI
ncbi:MAG: 3'-5' exonuclease domain-containing protein 2 [Bacteroidales bacterium]|nr:3'-5' exonuclease domain-containing protein 2 [Bacteroidales bacterium]